MKHAGWLIGISCAVGLVSIDSKVFAQTATQVAQHPESQWSMIQTYCFGCHNEFVKAGNLFLNQLSADSVPEHPEIFEKAVRKLRGRQMPPPGAPQPSQQEVDALVSWLESTLDKSGMEHLAGRVAVQRLNRTEYANAVQDLLAVEIDPTQYLPADIAVEGFSNIAAALTVSPAFLEQYIKAARVVARMAVGKPVADLVKASFPPPATGDQDGYVDGMPLGTRGGKRFEYTFPADGEYRVTITDFDFGNYPRGVENETTVVVLIDRKEVFRQKVGGEADLAFVDRGGGAQAHGALRQYSRAGDGRCARSRRDVHRALPGGNRRPDCRRYPILRASYQGVSPCAARPWTHSRRGALRGHGPDAHTQPGEVIINLQARSARAGTRLRRAHHARSRRACLPPARHQGRYRQADGLLRRRP